MQWGVDVRVRGRLRITGPGRVRIGDRVVFDRFGGTNHLVTMSPDAVIEIGPDSYVNGAALCATTAITLGRGCILGQTYIIDNDFHSVSRDRRESDRDAPRGPVRIGSNVWLANRTVVTRDVAIGDNSVVGIGTVVTTSVPANVVVAGPAFRILRHLDIED